VKAELIWQTLWTRNLNVTRTGDLRAENKKALDSMPANSEYRG
jgi:hypothetical protein